MLDGQYGWVIPLMAAAVGAGWGALRGYGAVWTTAGAIATAAMSSLFAIPTMLATLLAMVSLPGSGEEWALLGIILVAVALVMGVMLGLVVVAALRRLWIESRRP